MKIKSISEAFSIQPKTIQVCMKEMDYSNFPNNDKEHIHSKECVKAIGYSQKNLVDGGVQREYECLRAWNYDGEVLFDFVATAMNIEYFTE